MADGGGHAPDLAVAAFDENQFQPRSGNIFAEANGRFARRQIGLFRQQSHLRRARVISLNAYALPKPLKRPLIGNALYLRPIGAGMAKFRIGEPMLEPAIIGQKKQPFTVAVQPPHRIDIFDRDVSLERVGSAGELAQYAVRLVENQVAQEVRLKQVEEDRSFKV